MRIGIDGQLLSGKKTGMGFVLESILKRITIPNNIKVILYINDCLPSELIEILVQKDINIKRLNYSNYMIWEQIILPHEAKKDKIDRFWFPYNTSSIFMNCEKIITIHDLIFMYGSPFSPATVYKKMGKIYRRLNVPISAKKAKKIITISQSAKNEIIKYFPNTNSKVSICYNGCEYSNNYLNIIKWNEFKLRVGLKNKYILAFGSLEERKNTMRTIKAYQLFKKNNPEYDLVLFGFRGYENSNEFLYVKGNNIEGIYFLEYISEEEKNTLYKEAECFLFPSLTEGFGIPILESFYNRTPVITSNCSSMPEIGGDAAIYINPYNIESIADGINIALERRNELIEKGFNRVNLFDWDKSTKKYEIILFR